MTRIALLQTLIEKSSAQRYLEIGVKLGDTFLHIRARRKTGVDPLILPPLKKALHRRFVSNLLSGTSERLILKPSDAYFARLPARRLFDVIFIDALHTYEQSLRDTENALRHLAPDGSIVLHDCNPPNVWASSPIPVAGEWCGEVWKTIVHLRSHRPDIRVRVFDTDYGLGIVTRGTPDNMLTFSKEEIERLQYRHLEAERGKLLNLSSEADLQGYLQNLSQ